MMLDTVTTGDARLLAERIPDGSIDLVFTDPVYDRIDDYRWLAETAARVLKPGGSLVAYIAKTMMPDVMGVFGGPLVWGDILVQRETARRRRNWAMRTRGLVEVALWYTNGALCPVDWVPDFVFVSNGWCRADEFHDWGKLPQIVSAWIRPLTHPAAVVYDPFTGGGTVPAVCKMLGRHYIASEIDPDTAELARERVRNTQPPLFVEAPTQAVMELSA